MYCNVFFDFQIPKTESEWTGVAEQFSARWNFPHCLGSMDGKHVQIVAPENSGSMYYNYKGHFSIVLFGVGDANYNFIYADVGCQGRISDGGVFKYTSLYNKMVENKLNIPPEKALPSRSTPVPYVFVADDAFALTTHVMKPYPGRLCASPAERIFNYRLSRARRIIENIFGIISSKFRVLLKPTALHPDKVEAVVLTIIYIHNFLRRNCESRSFYTPPGSFDLEDADGNLVPGQWRSELESGLINLQNMPVRALTHVHKIRDEFRDYFISPEGAVPWQNNL